MSLYSAVVFTTNTQLEVAAALSDGAIGRSIYRSWLEQAANASAYAEVTLRPSFAVNIEVGDEVVYYDSYTDYSYRVRSVSSDYGHFTPAEIQAAVEVVLNEHTTMFSTRPGYADDQFRAKPLLVSAFSTHGSK